MLTLREVEAAAERIGPGLHRTPLIGSASLSALAGAPVHFKCEQMQKTGSFKARGALNRLSTLSEEEKARGVVCYSSGNHAQAVCWAARELGIEAWVYMPVSATPAKVAACRGYGGHIVQVGNNGAETQPHARAFAQEHGCVWVDPVEDPLIMAGQGTAGLEIADQLPGVDAVFVPVGGGGLLSGVAAAIKGRAPGARVIGVEPQCMDAVQASLAAGRIVERPRRETLADGLSKSAPGPLAFENIRQWVDEVITVTEEEIARATLLLMQRAKVFIEPSAAASLAGLAGARKTSACSPGATPVSACWPGCLTRRWNKRKENDR